MSGRRRVAVTGVGVASPAGVGLAAFRERLRSGEPVATVPPRARPEVPVPPAVVGFPVEFEAERHADPRTVRKVSGLSRLAIAAAAIALEDARFPADPALREATGLSLGTSFGSGAYQMEYHEALRRQGIRAASALLFTESVFNAASGHASKVFGLRGANHTFVGGHDAGLAAVAVGADRIALGAAPAVLAGGAEEVAELVLASIAAAGVLDPATPFAEGAIWLVLEDLEAARARGATIRAEVLASGRGRPEAAVRRSAAEAGRELEFAISTLPRTILGEGFAYGSAALAAIAAIALEDGPRTVLALAGNGAGGATALVLGRAAD